jgi:hypothetical protein
MAIDRCVGHAQSFFDGETLKMKPQEAKGVVYRHRDRTPWKELQLWWRLNVGWLLSGVAKQVE